MQEVPDFCTVGKRNHRGGLARKGSPAKEGAMATVKEFVRMGLPPQTHLYDDPSLSAVEFLLAAMHDPSLPMSLRIAAARGLLPYTEPRPASIPSSYVGCKIIIAPFEPRTPDHDPHEGDHLAPLLFATFAHTIIAII